MRGTKLTAIIFTSPFLMAFTAEGAVTLPSDRTVTIHIREVPGNESSAVVFTIELDLVAQDSDGSDVGWDVVEIRFNDAVSPARSWVETAPIVNSADTLWWVTHADPLAPTAADFSDAPFLEGRAVPVSGTSDDLDYSFEGSTCNTNCVSLFSGDVGALDFSLTINGQQTPFLEGTEEPTAISEEPSPPGS